MTQITNDEIKKIELNILDEFVNFCNKNNLKYYLVLFFLFHHLLFES